MTDKKHFQTVAQAMAFGGKIGNEDASAAFNTCADHVSRLLEDAYACHRAGSFSTAVFLAITAIEETGKAELLILRSQTPQAQKGRDPLRDHKAKHWITIRPTTFMGRLPNILGDVVCKRLLDEAAQGQLVRLRETALYVYADETGARAPKSVVSKERSREILLLALEAADDILVGSTNHSYSLGHRFEAMIIELT